MADFARGEQIRALRDGRHLSQEDAAHEVGVSTRTLRAWEQGGKIKWENAKKLAAFYEVEPDTLVSRDMDAEPLILTAEQYDELNRKLDEILRRLARPDEDEQDAPIPKTPPPLPEAPPSPPGERAPRRRQTTRRRAS